ncbi:hypothetical protein ACFQ3W_24850 [Paenibacillus puldeungensis]|uniref:Uncharacterized protein n=1 Tax=Paenibacillus puldeungensis TaxID=696536 RepID=A0ABW3S4F4_9BACL
MFKLTNPQKLPDPIKVLESLSAELKQIVTSFEENQDANQMYKGIKDILKRGDGE